MLDLKALVKNYEIYEKKLIAKGFAAADLLALKDLFLEEKEGLIKLEHLRAKQKLFSKDFAKLKSNGEDTKDLERHIASNKQAIVETETVFRTQKATLEAAALTVPNITDDDVPVGTCEAENVTFKTVLSSRQFDFKIKPHEEIAKNLSWINFDKATQMSKSRFSILCQDLAKLERALVNFMLDFNAARGFAEISPPVILNEQALFNSCQLPKFKDDLYKIENDSLYLIPTSEVALVNFYADELLKHSDLPIKLTAATNCFRKEAGAAGKDTKGIMRQHQFHKVELVSFTKPDDSEAMLDEMVQVASDLLTALELPHRLVKLCTGDLGFHAAKTIDLEVWIPSQNQYREISSVSNVRDFQARRAKIRFKDENKKNTLVHTLNGSALAIGRTIIAILENHQNKDGTVNFPKILKPYLNAARS